MANRFYEKILLHGLTKALFQFFGLTANVPVGFDLNGQLKNVVDLGVTVSEAELALTDVTTANASDTKHGLLTKLSNTASEVLDGTSAWRSIATILGFTPANAAALTNVDNTSDADKPVSTAQGAADVAVADAAAAALLVESNQRIGNDAQYTRLADGAQSLLGGNAVARAIIIVVEIDTSFAAGDGAAPSFDIGETGSLTKFTSGLTTGTAGDKLFFAGFLSANTALVITATPATGETSTGAIHVTAIALPEA